MSKIETYKETLKSLELKKKILELEIQKYNSLINQFDLQEQLLAALAEQKEYNKEIALKNQKSEDSTEAPEA